MSTRPAFLFGGFCGKAIKEDAVLRDITRQQPRNPELPKYQKCRLATRNRVFKNALSTVQNTDRTITGWKSRDAESGSQGRFCVDLASDSLWTKSAVSARSLP
jgi:hypothetical protein